MNNLRERFTRWYYSKGYRVKYNDGGPGFGTIELVFYCPWWLRPIVWIFWSPSIYHEELGREFADRFLAGFSRKI